MARVVTTLGVILSGFIALSTGKDTCDMYAAVGQVLTLPLDYKSLSKTDVLSWKHNGTIIFYRQSADRVSVGKPEDVTATGSLLLKGLTFSSAGTYKADVLNGSETLIKQWTNQLCMMAKVSKPQVKFACDSKANVVDLTCYVATPTPQGLVFTWALNDKPLTGETKETLRISLTQLKGENHFACSAANRASKEVSASVRLTCAKSDPASLCFGPKVVVAALAGGGCLILLVIVLTITATVCWCRGRHKTLVSLEDGGAVRMAPLTRQHKQQPDSIGPEYESMHHIEGPETPGPTLPTVYVQAVSPAGTQAQDEPLQTASTNGREKPSPVPMPRTKTPQAAVK